MTQCLRRQIPNQNKGKALTKQKKTEIYLFILKRHDAHHRNSGFKFFMFSFHLVRHTHKYIYIF
jgi:hypothetical protein